MVWRTPRIGHRRGNLSHADGTHHGQRRVEPARQQGHDLFTPSIGKHRLETGIAAGEKPLTRRQKDDRHKRHTLADAAHALCLPFPKRPARRPDDLERTCDAACIVRRKPGGRIRILLNEGGMGLFDGERARGRAD